MTAAPRKRGPNHIRSGGPRAVPRVVVLEGTLTRNADGSEMIVTNDGYRYTLRRMPGCTNIGGRTPKKEKDSTEVVYSDCLEYAMARLLVAQAIRDKPKADNRTLREWLRTPGGHMVKEFQEWPDQDVATMIEICRRGGKSKFISGDFPRPPRRQPVRERDSLELRYRFRGSYRGRVFEAQSIERV